MTANLFLLGGHLCVCVRVSWFVKDSCRSRQCGQWRRATGAPASPWHSIKDNKMGTERERDMKARRGDGDGRGLVLRGIWPVWGDRCFCVDGRGERTHGPVASDVATPPWDEQTDVWRGCAGKLRVSELIQPLSNDTLSSPFHHHHVLFTSSSRLTFTIPPELLILWHLISQTQFLTFSTVCTVCSVAVTHACIVCHLCVCT